MRILIVTPYFPPDLGPSAPLFCMLSRQFRQRGHDVTVLAAVPHYPTGTVSPEFRGHWIQHSLEDDVNVVRVRVPSGNRSRLGCRVSQFVAYQLGAVWAGLHEPYDVLLVCNPALWTWLPVAVLSVLRRKPAVFSVHDVYPDVGVSLGVFRNKSIIWAVARMERFCLHHSEYVRYLSESFRPRLRALGVPTSKMTLIYDWADTDLIRPLPRHNTFSQEQGLNGLFTVMYAGNLGLSQGLETVLTAARLLADRPEISFLFVGDGSGKEHLVKKGRELALTNVRFVPFQPRQRLPEVLASADVSLVVLRRGIGSGSLPSKTFSILASGRPVLACVEQHTDTWTLLKRSGAGLCLPPEDPEALAEAILQLRDDPLRRQQLGVNGRAWVQAHHSPKIAAEQFERLLMAAMERTSVSGEPEPSAV